MALSTRPSSSGSDVIIPPGRHRDAPRRRQHGLVAISGALACSGGGGVVLLACAPCSTYTRGDVVGLLTIIRLKCWCWGFTLLAVTQEDCGAEMTELIHLTIWMLRVHCIEGFTTKSYCSKIKGAWSSSRLEEIRSSN